jgi:hypothetical protein
MLPLSGGFRPGRVTLRHGVKKPAPEESTDAGRLLDSKEYPQLHTAYCVGMLC